MTESCTLHSGAQHLSLTALRLLSSYLEAPDAVAPKCEPGAGGRVHAHRLQEVGRLLHAAERRRRADPGGLGRSVAGVSGGDVLGRVRLRRQGARPPRVLLLPHQPLPERRDLHRHAQWLQVRRTRLRAGSGRS